MTQGQQQSQSATAGAGAAAAAGAPGAASSAQREAEQAVTSEKIGPFTILETLGEGSTAKVKLAMHRETGQQVAIKIINKAILTNKPILKRKIEREIQVMKVLRHPHVIRLFDVLQTKKYLFLIIEYAEGGELFDYIVQRGRLSMEEAFHFFKQIIDGIQFCHGLQICHRDLKPENLLLDGDNNIKIADFGMASIMSEDKMLETSCGSPHYASPEIVKGEKYDGTEADVWSCGVILYALLTGQLPFDDDDTRAVLLKVKSGIYEMPDFLEPDIQDLIRQMLQVNPKRRIKIAAIKRHPWWNRMDAKLKYLQEVKAQQQAQRPRASSSASASPSSSPSPSALQESVLQAATEDSLAKLAVSKSAAAAAAEAKTAAAVLATTPEQPPAGAVSIAAAIAQAEAGATEDGLDAEHDDHHGAEGGGSPSKRVAGVPQGQPIFDPLPSVLDQRIIDAIKHMGWTDEDKLRESLSNGSPCVEAILYRLFEKQLSEFGKIALPESFSPALSVTPNNPIRDDVDSAAMLRQRLKEATSLIEQEVAASGGSGQGSGKGKQGSGSSGKDSKKESPASWFNFWRKKLTKPKKMEADQTKFGLHSMKSHAEIMSELARGFKILHITWESSNDSTTIRAAYHNTDDKQSVEFDIAISPLPMRSGYLLNFSKVSGSAIAARILFDVLAEELQL